MPTKSAILGALSLALDLVEGQPEGHALRTCRLAARLGRELQLSDNDIQQVIYAGLLKDTGCSNNSVRVYKMFGGDELVSKNRVKLIDWTSPVTSIKFMLENSERGRSVGAKLRRMAANVGTPSQLMREVTEARCTRGAEIAKMLGFDETVSMAVRDLDEHWDGRGAPRGLVGEAVSLPARILCLCQTFEVFLTAYNLETAYAMISERSGRWFDPELVTAMQSVKADTDFWWDYNEIAFADAPDFNLVEDDAAVVDVDIDRICNAFGMIVDAKSSFTWDHSVRVAKYALDIADWMGLSLERRVVIRRAALLHDIGKLGISTCILEKAGRLESDEMAIMKSHPKHSFEILTRVPTFGRIAEIASGHHERLDGNGYWQGLCAEQLDLETRILTAADVFEALSTRRPYKEALPLEQVFAIMDREAGSAFDPECVTALHETQSTSLQAAA
jgi:putative nucleotidyltransferase with HDIG domain